MLKIANKRDLYGKKYVTLLPSKRVNKHNNTNETGIYFIIIHTFWLAFTGTSIPFPQLDVVHALCERGK